MMEMIQCYQKYQTGGGRMAVVNIRDFPEDLHREAKVRAALDGVSMKEVIIRALTVYLKEKPYKQRKKGGKHGN
jgi:hypothetical protein